MVPVRYAASRGARLVNPKRTLSRRRFIASGASLAAPWFASRANAAADVDVVVVGAGAAGLAAARSLLSRGLSVMTLEASNRVGGRAHTDHTIFGVPYDIGAHWLHRGATNPFLIHGLQNGFNVYPDPDKQSLYYGDRKATPEEIAEYQAAYRAAIRAISTAGRKGQDVSPASVVPDAGLWDDLVHFAIGPWEMAKDFDDFSCVDWWNSEDGQDWFCKEGYGAIVAHSARGLDVALSTRVTRVDWSGSGVIVETADSGRIRARACILTVSTGVLANVDIVFVPSLPLEKRESINAISMGVYNHIALLFDQNVFGTGPDEYLLYNMGTHGSHSPALMGLKTNVSGTGLALADVGGDFAMELEEAGPEAAIDFAKWELRVILNIDVDRHLVKAHFTRWGHNTLTRGSYASARPGAYRMRSVLRRPVGERIWFAGEACSSDEWATVGGAHKSGVDTAGQVSRALLSS